MFLKLFIVFTILPVAELYLLIKIGGIIGALNTVIIILITAVSGAYLTKTQGVLVFSQIKAAINESRIPTKELLHGLFVLIGGLALLTPGFITDVVGITMLVPFIREFYIKFATHLIQNKIKTGEWKFNFFS